MKENYFEKNSAEPRTQGNQKPQVSSIAPEVEHESVLDRVINKQRAKVPGRSYSFYLRCDLVEKLTRAAKEAGTGPSAFLNSILEDIFK